MSVPDSPLLGRLDHRERRANRHRRPFGDQQLGDHARLVGGDLVLHLHGLDDAHERALLDGRALLDEHLEDVALERRGERVTARPGGGAAGAEELPDGGSPSTRTSKRFPDTSTVYSRSTGSGLASSPPSTGSNASALSHPRSSTRSRQVSAPAHCSDAMIALWNGSSVRTPSMSNSSSARAILRVAASRSESHTISFATIGSYSGVISDPASTPESTRTPGPDGSRYRVTVPGAGAKFFEASSALMRHSIA